MAFKTYYFSLWMLFIFFTLVKGSCLEYGHSCWGAHGKRSGHNKIHHARDKTLMEFDLQDLKDLGEKDSYEEVLNGASEALPTNLYMGKQVADGDLLEGPDKNTLKLNKFLYTNLKRSRKNQRNTDFVENSERETNVVPAISERWPRLPLYIPKRVPIMRPENEWLNELEPDQQTSEADYI